MGDDQLSQQRVHREHRRLAQPQRVGPRGQADEAQVDPTAPAVAGVVLVPGPALLLFTAACAIGLSVPFSPHITLGQDYLPRHPGTAGGVTLGLAVSVGGVAGPLIGGLADATSPQGALAPLVALPGPGWFAVRPLREPVRLEHDAGAGPA
ncbi:hypothetical protein [Saccharothrix sp. Mg75]|uniref:hypothetical protein n=1 Tax=Saccharothrix sp. Mg75 TaxID=3445357 RepID=UPI003EEBA1C2